MIKPYNKKYYRYLKWSNLYVSTSDFEGFPKKSSTSTFVNPVSTDIFLIISIFVIKLLIH